MYQTLDAPLSVHLEFTSNCNHKCRHCYNFWRSSEDASYSPPLTKELAAQIVKQLSDSGVFHVTLTGGEPLLNMDVLIFTIKELKKNGISFSLNSNVTLLTKEKAKLLYAAGLRTILVSLLSYNLVVQDHITSRLHSHEKTVAGIKIAQESGLRIAINMVVSKTNLYHVVETGLFAKSLGAFAFSATRVMPPRYGEEQVVPEFILSDEDVRSIMHQMAQLKDSGLYLESLVPYPACFFETQEEVKIFGGRSCSAGKTSCAIGADGFVRACPHHEEKYGNVGNEILSVIWAKMRAWRDGSFLPDECKACPSVASCGGGCRVSAPEKSVCVKDPLMRKPENAFVMHKQPAPTLISMSTPLRVHKQCRFRNDATMGIVNVGGIKNTFVSSDTLQVLQKSKNQPFTPKELKAEYSITMEESDYLHFLSELVGKKVLELVV